MRSFMLCLWSKNNINERKCHMGTPIARVGDQHVCPLHPPSSISDGIENVKVDGQAIATIGSKTGCGATIITGKPSGLAQGKPVAHVGSMSSHGGVIVTGSGSSFV